MFRHFSIAPPSESRGILKLPLFCMLFLGMTTLASVVSNAQAEEEVETLSIPTVVPYPSPTPSPTPAPTPTGEGNRLVDQVAAAEKSKAELLWGDAMDKFATRNFKESAKLFQEYVNRYPGAPETIDARYNLAQSYLFGKDPKAAIPAFLAVIEVRGKSLLANEARNYLGQAFLDDSRFTEAFLVSEELLNQSEPGANLRAKALLLRAHAQAGMNQNPEAEKSLVAFQAIAENDPELEREVAGSFLVSLLLKGNHCDALPSKSALPEDQVLDQIARKGICVLEMSTLLLKASKRFTAEELQQGGDTLSSSLEAFQKSCEAPPLDVKRLSRAKAENAKKEMRNKLHDGCASTEKLLVEALKNRENLLPVLTRITSPKPPTSKKKKP